MKFFRNNKGFSLVELLIVITIIGILSTIVLESLSNSRQRAYDSKVKQQLNSFRTAAEVYFSNREPNGYGPIKIGCYIGNSLFNDVQAENGTPGLYIAVGNLPYNTQVECQSNESAYAVKASLYSGEEYWCVDSTGASRLIPSPIDGPSTSCPFAP